MKFIWILFIAAICQAQILTENFNNFKIDTNHVAVKSNIVALYRFNNSSDVNDLVNSHTLTANNSVGDSLVPTSYSSGDSSVYFKGTSSQFYSIAYASAADFRFTEANEITLLWRGYVDDDNSYKSIVSFCGQAGVDGISYYWRYNSSMRTHVDADNATLTPTSSNRTLEGTYAITIGSGGAAWTNATVWENGTAGSVVDVSGYSVVYTNNRNFGIGADKAGLQYWLNGTIYDLIIINDELTAKELKDISYLAYGWKSIGGDVTRLNLGYFQGVQSDTIYKAIPDSTMPDGMQPQLSFNYSTDGSSWTTSTTAFTRNFSGDSLLFGNDGTNLKAYYGSTGSMTEIVSVSSGATIYVDAISLTSETSDADDKGFKEFPKFSGFPNNN